MSLEEIQTMMSEAVSANEDIGVVLKGDRQVNLDKVVELMDLATEMKIKHFSLGMAKPLMENK